MKKFLIILALLSLFSASLIAESETEMPETKTQDNIVYKMNQKGDWFVKLGGATFIPLVPTNMYPGLDLNLGFYRFFTSDFSVGGDIRVAYTTTVGKNMFFSVPFMARASYQFSIANFEIPISLGLGIAIQNYIDRYYFGLVINPELGFFWRFKSDWSAGLHCGLNIMPQWYGDKTYNRTGLFLDTGLSIRYHF